MHDPTVTGAPSNLYSVHCVQCSGSGTVYGNTENLAYDSDCLLFLWSYFVECCLLGVTRSIALYHCMLTLTGLVVVAVEKVSRLRR